MFSFSASPSRFPEQDAMNKDQKMCPCIFEQKNHICCDTSDSSAEAAVSAEKSF